MNIKIPFVFIFIIYIGVFEKINAQSNGCDFIFYNSPQNTLMINGDLLNNLAPGDTICLQGGLYYQLNIKNLHGLPGRPIVIINKQGPVIINNNSNYGITFGHCTNIKFTGSGTLGVKYGFLINNVENGNGLSINYLSSDFEIECIEINNVAFAGIVAKTDPDCSFAAVRDSFELQNLSIHDNYIHNVGNEGMYIGNSHYTGITLTCNGADTIVFPHLLSGVKIYNNILTNIGWDGIQVSSSSNDCQIHDNHISYDSDSAIANQMSGILVGGGSSCDCYNNKINDGKGDGIDYFGLGNNKIYNNLIINSGKKYYFGGVPTENPKHGIYATDKYSIPNSSLYFYNNTIVSPKTNGIKFVNWNSGQNKAYNNVIVNPGNIYFDIPYDHFDTLGNFFAPHSSFILFDDTISQNYDLQVNSPLINRGVDLADEGITFDILNRSRPFNNLFDIGAYECHKDGADIFECPTLSRILIEIFPNPLHHSGNLVLNIPQKTFIEIEIYNAFGKKIKKILSAYKNQGLYNIELKFDNFPSGLYYVKINTTNEYITKKLLIIN